jgi:toxin ParE1/3/4
VIRVVLRFAVPADILEAVSYFAGANSLDAAERFPRAVEETLEFLAENPGAGSPKRFRRKALAGLRTWPVRGFPNHLIFYRQRPDAIVVSAVLHGARNIPKVLRDRP